MTAARLANINSNSALAATKLALELLRREDHPRSNTDTPPSDLSGEISSRASPATLPALPRDSSAEEQLKPGKTETVVQDVKIKTEDHIENINETSLFVGNLDCNVSVHYLKEYFQKFGQLIDCAVLEGYGFITFKEPQMLEACLKSQPHHLNGVRVDVQRRKAREEEQE